MPTNGHLAARHEARAHPAAYSAGRLRAMRARHEAAQAQAKETAARQRERREDARISASLLRGQAAEDRRSARQELEAMRADPVYPLYRRWGRRLGNATLYDAETWRRSGRLVAVTDRTRYRGGHKREVVDFTDVLDRETQELGITAHDLPQHFERIRRSEARAQDSVRAADESKRLADQLSREARNG